MDGNDHLSSATGNEEDVEFPLLPSGEKCRAKRGDEGVAAGPCLGASRTPSSGPSGHLLPVGEKREAALCR